MVESKDPEEQVRCFVCGRRFNTAFHKVYLDNRNLWICAFCKGEED